MPEHNTIFSVFLQGRGSNDFDYLAQLKPRGVKMMDAKQSEIDTIRSLTPDSYIINRIYVDDGEVAADIVANPEAAAEKHHGMIVDRDLSYVDYYQIQNEQCQKPPELEKLNRYYLRLMELCVYTGHRTTVIDCSVGNLHVEEDGPGDWVYVFPTLDFAQRNGFIVNCHQYSRESFWNPIYPNEWYLHRLEQTTLPVLDAAGFGRLLYVCGEFGLDRMLAVHGEEKSHDGWQYWHTHDDYREDLINVMSYLTTWSDRILGYTCFVTHANSPWQTYEMDRMNQDLAEYYNANPQVLNPWGGTAPPPADVLFQATVTVSTLNVRNGPGVEYPVVGQTHFGNVVDVTEVVTQAGGDWWGIVYGDLVGYSSSEYMKRIGDGGDLEQRVSKLEYQMQQVIPLTIENRSDIDKLIQDMAALTAITRDIDIRVDDLEDRVTKLEGGVIPPPSDAILSPGVQHMQMSVNPGGPYVIQDCFTTYHGSWDVSDNIYSITQHARDRYLRSDTGPCGGGGDHHIFAAVVDAYGKFVTGAPILFERTDHGGDVVYHSEIKPTQDCGWTNLPVDHPAFWRVKVVGGSQYMMPFALPNADGTMPGREHVSLFTVFQMGG